MVSHLGFNFSLPFSPPFTLSSNLSSVFPSHPLRTACVHTHKDQKTYREVRPHGCLYLETHVVRFRRPTSTVHIHVMQKNTPTRRRPQSVSAQRQTKPKAHFIEIDYMQIKMYPEWNKYFRNPSVVLVRQTHRQTLCMLIPALGSLSSSFRY